MYRKDERIGHGDINSMFSVCSVVILILALGFSELGRFSFGILIIKQKIHLFSN
jgi:hypothetical protein